MADDPDNAPIGGDPALGSLGDRIAAAHMAEDARMAKEHAPMRDGRGAAMQVASTMVGYPLGGFIVGFLVDGLFGTRPWIAIALMMLAFVGACVHIVRLGKNSAQ